MSTKTVDSVVVHPLVLLSVTDHYNRVAKDARGKRVVGVLLGESYKGRVDITNSFAVPFEEDAKEQTIFYLDHDYLESMYTMTRKIAAKERIVGFYSTGPKLRPADIELDALFRRYTTNPVLVLVDVRPETTGVPVQAYTSVEAVVEGKENVRQFAHVASEVGAYEAEEVGVEHLLRDINDPSVSALGAEVAGKLEGLRGLATRLTAISAYLSAVVDGKTPPNREILEHVQLVLARLPNLRLEELTRSLHEAANDQHAVVYVASLVRAVTSLHDLVANKLKYRDGEEDPAVKAKREADAKAKEERTKKAKEEEEKKKKDATKK